MRKITQGLLFIFLMAISNISLAYSFYGPTFENEHLYRIAIRVRPAPDLTIQQVMIAILDANPAAFYQNNINGLKPGVQLRLPTYGQIKSIAPQFAVNRVSYQNSLWQKRGVRWLKAPKHHKHIEHSIKGSITDVIPSISEANAVAKSVKAAANDIAAAPTTVSAKSSLASLASQQNSLSSPVNQNLAVNLPTPTVQPTVTTSANDPEFNHKVNSFMHETKQFEQQTNAQLVELQKQNRALQARVSQINNELKLVTYRLIKTTVKNPQNTAKDNLMILENAKKHSVGLSTGFISVILLTYLIMRSFRAKPISARNDEKKDEYDYMSSDESIPTKFDLASAYIDMGDEMAAASVLSEVIEKGNDEQRRRASDLLAKMNNKA